MANRSDLKPALLFLAILSLSCSYLRAQGDAPSDEVTRESLRFARIYQTVEDRYVDATDPDHVLYDGAIRGMLATLDPFSNFFDPDQFQQLQEQARGVAIGFGSILYVQTGKVVVLETAQGSPSWRAGLGPGDEIVEVNGVWIDRLDFQSMIDLLQRSRSVRVRLGVIHPGQVVAHDVTMDPAQVALPTVDKFYLLAGGVAYIHLASFEQKSAEEVASAVNKLNGQSPKGTVHAVLLDLRDNPGGIVDSAVAVASLFINPGSTVITVHGRNYPEKIHKTAALPAHFDFPLVVLVNGNTASAAEVLTSALQDHDRALIVGESTFGKGVVESVAGLGGKTGLALTTAQYLTASGRSLQRSLPRTALADLEVRETGGFHTDAGRPVRAGGGVTPDVVIPQRKLDPWAEFLNQRGVFTTFAAEYLSLHARIDEGFEPEDKTLNDFRDYLGRSGIRAPQEYWRSDQDYLKLKIKIDLMTLTRGLDTGQEIEVRTDPQVAEAAQMFPKIAGLLKPMH